MMRNICSKVIFTSILCIFALNGCNVAPITESEARNYKDIYQYMNERVGKWKAIEKYSDSYRITLTPDKDDKIYHDLKTLCESQSTSDQPTQLYWDDSLQVPASIPRNYLQVHSDRKSIGNYKCQRTSSSSGYSTIWHVVSQPQRIVIDFKIKFLEVSFFVQSAE